METTIVHERSEPQKDIREAYNRQLKDKFGIDTLSGLPMWRVSWAPAQFNKQLGVYDDHTEGGIYLRTVKEVREVPKYDYLHDIYVLEMLMVIPEVQQIDLPTGKLSYECMHPIMHSITHKYLPLNWEFIEWVCDCYYAGVGDKSLRKYVSDEGTDVPSHLRGIQAKLKRVGKIMQYLYGNETSQTDALSHGTGVINAAGPQHFGKTEQ